MKRKKRSWRVRQDDCYARAAHLRATLSSLSLSHSLSLPLPRSLSPSSQWRAHAIFDESRGHVGFSLSRVSTTNFKRSRGNQWRKRELSQRIGEWKFLFSISAVRSNRSEITTRKIVKKKERRLSSFSSRENVRRFPRSLSDVFYTCFRGINEVFPASTKFR